MILGAQMVDTRINIIRIPSRFRPQCPSIFRLPLIFHMRIGSAQRYMLIQLVIQSQIDRLLIFLCIDWGRKEITGVRI